MHLYNLMSIFDMVCGLTDLASHCIRLFCFERGLACDIFEVYRWDNTNMEGVK